MKDTAILVTTFLRDELLFRCIKSIRKYYKDIPIFIGDNGRPSEKKTKFAERYNCVLFELPFDLGVAGVRNESLKRIPDEYEFIVICEDDIIFTKETKLECWRKILDAEPDVGIVGGLLITPDGDEQHYEANTWIENDTHYIEKVENPEWRAVDGINYFLCDLILNVFMMRRAVWDKVKWDEQFKTALEHSDFFLRVKYDSKWKVAYTPDVYMVHDSNKENTEYLKYRQRPVGWRLFGRKWGVTYSISSFNKINPLRYDTMGKFDYSEKDEALEKAVRILEEEKIKWWLEAGTCLGAIREKDFISHDPDIDIGIAPGNLKHWDKLKKRFLDAGFEFYKEWRWGRKKIELSFRWKGIKVDLFFFFKKGNIWWHGAFGPGPSGKYDKFLPHVFPAELFEELEEILFRNIRCFVPSPPEKYLEHRYGKDWRVPKKDYKYWIDCQAIDPAFFKKNKTVFVGGVWDLFHVGHLNILEKAKKLGSYLIVGVLTDRATRKYKDSPIIPFEQRKRIIEALAIVDEVIEQHDPDPTRDFQRLSIHPDYIVHGDDWDHIPGEEFVRVFGGKAVFLPYTKDINSSLIKEKIRRGEVIRNRGKRAGGKKGQPIAIGIKTFLREETFLRCIQGIEENFPFPYRLYIADDGRISHQKEYLYQQLERNGHVVIRLPFGSGISVGRNAIVSRVTEDYILILDDDILLTNGKAIENMKKVLDSDDEIGIVSGLLRNEPDGNFYVNENYNKGLILNVKDKTLFRYPSKKEIHQVDGVYFLYADQVPNFFLARREVFDDVKWDNRIKVEYEHMDFFLSLMKHSGWKVAVCLDSETIHMRSKPDLEYLRHRRQASPVYFYQKWDINSVINRF